MKAVIRFDGGSRGNPGKSACGFNVEINGKNHIDGKYLGIATNNQAEYSGLIESLKYLIKKYKSDDLELEIYSDSELLVRQINGEYRVKSENIIGIYKEAVNLLCKFKSYNLKHNRREHNKISDSKVNEILDSH